MATAVLTPRPAPPVARGPAVWVSARLAAHAVVALFATANVGYLLIDCPAELAPDEAHYWDWSRRPPEWSYYSKGPLVAWLIRGSCGLFGPTVPAVRLPAVACNALLLLGVRRLAAQTFASDQLALAAVAAALTLPPVAAPAVLMTIDAPFLAAWAWACVFAQRATSGVGGGPRWTWAAASAAAAVGVLAKYTMLLFPGCVALYLLADRDRRREFRRPGFWLLVAGVGVGLLPLGVWNAGHGWVGLRHVATQATGPDGAGGDPAALPVFLAGQAGMLVGYWFAAWAAAVVRYRPWRLSDRRTAFLWWTSVPVWGLFLAAAINTKVQANWPAAAYVPGLVLAVGWVTRQVTCLTDWYRRLAVGCLSFAVVAGVGLTVAARYPRTVRPVLAEAAGPPTAGRPVPLRRLDPTCRVAGWRQLAAAVDAERDRVRAEEGREPAVAAMTWTVPGELAFYCRGRPEVYTFGPALGDRHSQYDLWRPNPVADAQAFRGRTFVYVGEAIPDARLRFDRIDPPVEVLASDGGIPVAGWTVWVLRGFRGFPGAAGDRGY